MFKTRRKRPKGKERDLFRKTGNIKGTFCPKMGTIKDINGIDLADAEGIKRRWREYTEELYRKGPKELDCSSGVVSHLEPDIRREKSSRP